MKKGFTWRWGAVINPADPIGTPYDAGPTADVLAAFAQGRAGGSQRHADEHKLEMAHAGVCRIIREIERKIGGNNGIDDRMRALGVGYNETVGRRGTEAAKFLTETSCVSRFDQHIGHLISAMTSMDESKTVDQLKAARDRRCEHAKILMHTRTSLGKASNYMRRFRNRNVKKGDLPTFGKLSVTFLPARNLDIITPSIDEMLIIAMVGLFNPVWLYRDFSYLHDPFELATMIGSAAIYMKRVDKARLRDIQEVRSLVIGRRAPDCVRSHPRHVECFEAVCARVERSWHDTLMPRFIA